MTYLYVYVIYGVYTYVYVFIRRIYMPDTSKYAVYLPYVFTAPIFTLNACKIRAKYVEKYVKKYVYTYYVEIYVKIRLP